MQIAEAETKKSIFYNDIQNRVVESCNIEFGRRSETIDQLTKLKCHFTEVTSIKWAKKIDIDCIHRTQISSKLLPIHKNYFRCHIYAVLTSHIQKHTLFEFDGGDASVLLEKVLKRVMC